MVDEVETDDTLQDALEAAVHVHFVADDLVDVSIQRGNIWMGTPIRREEIEILILALHNCLECVAIHAGDVVVNVTSDPTDPDERKPGLDDLATISIAYAGSDPVTAMRDREALIDLLRGGCSAPGSSARTSDRPAKSKCN